jgi:hypothetical protein
MKWGEEDYFGIASKFVDHDDSLFYHFLHTWPFFNKSCAASCGACGLLFARLTSTNRRPDGRKPVLTQRGLRERGFERSIEKRVTKGFKEFEALQFAFKIYPCEFFPNHFSIEFHFSIKSLSIRVSLYTKTSLDPRGLSVRSQAL